MIKNHPEKALRKRLCVSTARRRPNLSLYTCVYKETLKSKLTWTRSHSPPHCRDGCSFPCLSLFLVYRNHFNELNSLLQTPGLACPVFPVCGCKGTTKNQYQPNISATFFQEFFRKIPKTSHISLLPLQFFYALQHIFPTRLSEIMQKPIFFSLTPQFPFTHYK